MSTQLKLRRGTTAQHSTFTGASGEVTVDTDKKTLVVHDGTTAGGQPLVPASDVSTSGGASKILKTDASGNLGLGVTPSAWGSGLKALDVGSWGAVWTNNASNLVVSNNTYYDGANYKYKNTGPVSQFGLNNGAFTWLVAASGSAGTNVSFTQAMTLDASGNLLVGTTTVGSGTYADLNALAFYRNEGSLFVEHITGTTSGTRYVDFSYAAGRIGSISQNGTTGVLYNITSDYRLKNDPQPLTGAKDFVMSLQPKTWDWWDGSGKGVGFIAHEFMEVAKYSGQGEKDAVDENDNPIYQSIQPSSSEVMANMVAFMQEQQALITSLTERITALEGAK